MKRIQIVALLGVLAAAAVAQNSGTNTQNTGVPPKTANQPQSGSTKTAASTADTQKPSGGVPDTGQKKKKAKTTKSTTAQKKTDGATSMAGKSSAAATPPKSKGLAAAGGTTAKSGTPAAGASKGKAQGTAASSGSAAGKTGPIVVSQKKKKKKSEAGKTAKKKTPAKPLAAKKEKQTKPKLVQQTPKPPTATTPATRPVRASAAGRRDPFVSVIRPLSNEPLGPKCSQGKRCLYIPELIVQGTVRDTSGKMVAVVVNRARHTYFLRESDQVFNGSVQKITTDSVVFREFVTDNLGRETAHEVVKRVGGGVPST